MKTINRQQLIGKLGKDAELKSAGVVKFSIATNNSFKDKQTDTWKEEVDWHNCILFNGEKLAQYLTKGTTVYVEGRTVNRSYEDKEGNKRYITEVHASNVILLGSKPEGSARPAEGSHFDDSVPF